MQAATLWDLALQLLCKRCSSMGWHSRFYPVRFALLLRSDPKVMEDVLHQLKQGYSVWQAASAFYKSAFLKQAAKSSPFQTAFVREFAEFLCNPSPDLTHQQVLQKAQ